jgi:DNA polymerase-3 subunit beta
LKFLCPQSILSEAINTVSKAVSTKSTHPILNGILIEASGQEVILTGNDLSLGIETRFLAEVLEEGSVVVPARLFGDIVRKLMPLEVSIEVNQQHEVRLICDKSDFKLMGLPDAEFTELPEIDSSSGIEIECGLLKSMIRQTIFATSLDESRPILTGALIEFEKDKLSMVAIDGYRLALRQTFITTEIEGKVVVPSKTLNEVAKIISNIADSQKINVLFTDKHILFEFNSVRIVSRLLEGEFIKYSQILPKENKTILKVLTSHILDSLERASLMAKESKNSSIKLSIRPHKMNILSNVEIGSVNEEVTIDLNGPELDIGFNPKYLIDALKVMDSEYVVMEFSTNVSPCIMKPADHSHYTYLVLPVRMA